jgi:hypothetical protein
MFRLTRPTYVGGKRPAFWRTINSAPQAGQAAGGARELPSRLKARKNAQFVHTT